MLLLLVIGVIGTSVAAATSAVTGVSTLAHPLFGLHYWVIAVLAVAFVWWKQGMVMVRGVAAVFAFGQVRVYSVRQDGREGTARAWTSCSRAEGSAVQVAGQAERRELLEDLRAMVTYLEANPHLPVGEMATVELTYYPEGCDGNKEAEVLRVADRMGLAFGLRVPPLPPVDFFYDGPGPWAFGDYDVFVHHTGRRLD